MHHDDLRDMKAECSMETVPTSVQQHTIEDSSELKTKNKIKKIKRPTKRNKPATKLFVIHGKKTASLLTCTIKASFAKRECTSLFLGDKRLRERVIDRRCEFHEGGFGYLVCHNKGHFCHEHRQCDIGKCLR